MEIVAIVGLVLKMVITIMSEILSAKARARERNEKFKIEKKQFLVIVDNAVIRLRKELSDDSRDAGDVEDRVDRDIQR